MKYLYEKRGTLRPPTSLPEVHSLTKVYDDLYPDTNPLPIDLRAKIKSLYGRVDPLGYPVIPKKKYISQIDVPGEETYYALDIVRGCFEEMSSYYSKLSLRGKLSANSVSLKEILPTQGWSDPSVSYSSYILEMIEIFDDAHFDSPTITAYKSYEQTLVSYFTEVSSLALPVTFAEFILSTASSPTSSGLVIDIAIEDASDDVAKYDGFIRDPNYEVYRSVAKRFGFKVDKHVPWRLYFDLKSPYVIQKMKEQGITGLKEFFSRYYDRVCTRDLESLSGIFPSAYTRFYEENFTFTVPEPCPNGTRTVMKGREPISNKKTFHEEYGPSHFLRLYIFLRAVEVGKGWSQRDFDRIVRSSQEIMKYRGAKRAMRHAESKFTDRTTSLFLRKPRRVDQKFDNLVTNTYSSRTFQY